MKRRTVNAGLLAKTNGPRTKPRKKEIALKQKLLLIVVKLAALSRNLIKKNLGCKNIFALLNINIILKVCIFMDLNLIGYFQSDIMNWTFKCTVNKL